MKTFINNKANASRADLVYAIKEAIWGAQKPGGRKGSRASKPVQFNFIGDGSYSLVVKHKLQAGGMSAKAEQLIEDAAAALSRGVVHEVAIFRNQLGGVTVEI